MPHRSALSIVASPAQSAELQRLQRQSSLPQAIAQRIRIVVAALENLSNKEIMRRENLDPELVRRWRKRWHDGWWTLQQIEHDPAAQPGDLARAIFCGC